MRGSACKVPELIAMPEGLIDPMLKTVAFYSGDEKIVACHYYATHPMSHYGKGDVSSDFPGSRASSARRRSPAARTFISPGARATSLPANTTTAHRRRVWRSRSACIALWWSRRRI